MKNNKWILPVAVIIYIGSIALLYLEHGNAMLVGLAVAIASFFTKRIIYKNHYRPLIITSVVYIILFLLTITLFSG